MLRMKPEFTAALKTRRQRLSPTRAPGAIQYVVSDPTAHQGLAFIKSNSSRAVDFDATAWRPRNLHYADANPLPMFARAMTETSACILDKQTHPQRP